MNVSQNVYMSHEQLPGDKSDIRMANPRICQTDFAGFMAGTRSTNTLFHRYFPKKRINTKIKNTVRKETNRNRPGAASIPCEFSNVSVRE